jgi:hypothetical protein
MKSLALLLLFVLAGCSAPSGLVAASPYGHSDAERMATGGGGGGGAGGGM